MLAVNNDRQNQQSSYIVCDAVSTDAFEWLQWREANDCEPMKRPGESGECKNIVIWEKIMDCSRLESRTFWRKNG